MQFKRLFLLFLFVVISSSVFAQQYNEQFLIAEQITEVQKVTASITINSNVRNASVYLNGQYYGTTPCTITDLAPGTYRLRLTKQGYNSVSHYVSISRKQNSSFYVEMERLVGFIRLYDLPDNCSVYCDDSLISSYSAIGSTIELSEGYHTIIVRKFGYVDFSTYIYVTRRIITPIHVLMSEQKFSLSNFTSSKKQINPEYTNSLGTCSFSFKVTAPETAVLTITDEAGLVVFSYSFPTFTTWNQKIAWNGRSETGEVLPDGNYCATITAGEYSEKVYIKINSALRYHVADISYNGSSIGNLPAPFTQGEKTVFLGLSASPSFQLKKENPFYGVPINFFFGFNPVTWVELSTGVTLHAGVQGRMPVSLNGAVKFSTQIATKESFEFSVGGVIRYGGTLNNNVPHSDGSVDTGNGLGIGFALGLDGKKVFGGISTEYIFGVINGNLTDRTQIWKNGFSLEVRPVPKVSIKAWGALNSALTSTENVNWLSAVDTGLSASFMLGDSSAVLFVKGNALLLIKKENYIFASIGLSYLF